MPEQLKHASTYTLRSSLFLLNKAIAFIFAIFCVITGQVKGPAIKSLRQVDFIKVKGKVYSSYDSSIIENVKVVISGLKYTDSWYGFFDAPIIDTSKADGSYEISIPNSLTISDGEMEVIDVDGDKNGKFFTESFSLDLGDVTGDTVINIYLNPEDVSASKSKKIKKVSSIVESNNCNNVIIMLNNYSVSNCEVFAKVFNSSGKLIDEMIIPNNGKIIWNTARIAKGTYFFKIPNKRAISTLKIKVK